MSHGSCDNSHRQQREQNDMALESTESVRLQISVIPFFPNSGFSKLASNSKECFPTPSISACKPLDRVVYDFREKNFRSYGLWLELAFAEKAGITRGRLACLEKILFPSHYCRTDAHSPFQFPPPLPTPFAALFVPSPPPPRVYNTPRSSRPKTHGKLVS